MGNSIKPLIFLLSIKSYLSISISNTISPSITLATVGNKQKVTVLQFSDSFDPSWVFNPADVQGIQVSLEFNIMRVQLTSAAAFPSPTVSTAYSRCPITLSLFYGFFFLSLNLLNPKSFFPFLPLYALATL